MARVRRVRNPHAASGSFGHSWTLGHVGSPEGTGGWSGIVTPSLGASGGIGRRAGFRFLCPKGCGGSSPPSPTQGGLDYGALTSTEPHRNEYRPRQSGSVADLVIAAIAPARVRGRDLAHRPRYKFEPGRARVRGSPKPGELSPQVVRGGSDVGPPVTAAGRHVSSAFVSVAQEAIRPSTLSWTSSQQSRQRVLRTRPPAWTRP
jgi:hypothetical protein